MFGCRITLGVRHAFVLFSEIVVLIVSRQASYVPY